MGSGEKMRAVVPPGFRFHPTDEELLSFYLRQKVDNMFELDHVICEVDLNQLEPWDLSERCRMDVSHQTEWYFFSYKGKKYPTGTRTNRATKVGFWKATGRDKSIFRSCGPEPAADGSRRHGHRIGMRKTLVFYQGRAPRGLKTDWIMHEYRLYDEKQMPPSSPMPQPQTPRGPQLTSCHQRHRVIHHVIASTTSSSSPVSSTLPVLLPQYQEDGWVVCRVFKKRNYEERSMCAPLSYKHVHEALSNSNASVTRERANSSVGRSRASKQGHQIRISSGRETSHNFDKSRKTASRACCKAEAVEEEDSPLPMQLLQLPQLQSPKMTSNVNDACGKTMNTLSSECMKKRNDNNKEVQGVLQQGLPMTNDLTYLLDNIQSCQSGEQFNWNLDENIARYQDIEGFENLACDQNFNLHSNRITYAVDSYPSNCEIELWSFPR